ncbi:MAG: hypothetical protein IT371_05345 [Deltaproteobacteria bacterium]|nr:hypothetical protein [Deltaproteobacteria bacterium]
MDGPRFYFWPKRLALLLYVGLAYYAAQQAALPRLPAIVLFVLPLVAIEGALRALAASRMRAFNQALTARLQSGDAGTLLPFYQAQRLLRLLAPKHELLAKLGLIHQRLGQKEAAATALREAAEDAPPKVRPAYLLPAAEALLAAGEAARAEHYFRQAASMQAGTVQAPLRAARLILARGGDRSEADRFLRAAVAAALPDQPCGPLRPELAQLLLELGYPDEARWQLELARRELGSDGAAAALPQA